MANLNKNDIEILNENSSDSKIFQILKENYIYFVGVIRSFFKNKNFLKYFGFTYGLYFIGIFGLLLIDVYHRDDIWRSQGGVPGFSGANRYLSEFLSHFFHASYPKIADISPINQLIAIAFISLASLMLVKIVNKKITYIGLIASLSLGLNPWYLQCLSYKYDSVFMALATLCAVIPFLFIKKKFAFFIISIISLVSLLNLYQTNNGIYLIISLFIILNLTMQRRNIKDIINFILVGIFAFVLSLLIYKFIFFIQDAAGSDINDIAIFLANGKKLLAYLKWSVGEHIIKYLFFISIPFFIIAMLQKRKINLIISCFLLFIFLSIGLFVSYGSYIFLSNFFPQARGVSQIGGFLAIVTIVAVSQKQKILSFLSKCVVIYLSYCLITISNAYANAFDTKEKFDEYRINLMLKDLNRLLPINPKTKYSVFIAGSQPKEPFNEIYKNSLPLIDNLVAQISNHRVYLLRQKGISSVKKSCKKENEKAKKVVETRFHKIEVYDNNCFEIEFR